MQSLGTIVQRAPAVGAKMWCLFCFFVFCFVCHAPSPERRVFEGCIVRTRIACRLSVDFDGFGSFFSEGIALSDKLRSSHIRR